MSTNADIISTRTTFDGVTVYLHADGAVSDRRSYLGRSRLPVGQMWRVWEDICTYTHAEIGSLIKAVRAGTWTPVRVRSVMTEARHQEILSMPSRRGQWVNGWLIGANRK